MRSLHALRLVEMTLYLLAGIIDGLGGAVGEGDDELALLQHTGVVALLRPEGQGAGGVIPLEENRGIGAFLISVAVALVLVKQERAVGTRIDTDLELIPSLLSDILHLWG